MAKEYKIPKICTDAIEQAFADVDLDGSGEVSVCVRARECLLACEC